ncbi:phorbol-12-myristate-13-acetate-induced protein 1 [Pelodiscus sinensis]|uniref:phorbol-12-myristate-13-acetate-induced protein 1 n=1 Tax=Pelodiscus sinensis TaxID=13735 RepID=UPI0003C4CB51|nr:phorbol-12-myristate-13-acetate-induced protein 1 [Pelodiscus sinensis]|eukprot:XP_006116589.1 phorbol-12-myristate-13-acetate-induced protein 1 [Pelodiscus sinensis]
MMPGKPLRKGAQQPPAPAAEQESIIQCALQLRKIGDILNLQQKILNVITKLFCPGT